MRGSKASRVASGCKALASSGHSTGPNSNHSLSQNRSDRFRACLTNNRRTESFHHPTRAAPGSLYETMRRSGSTNGDVTVASVEMNAMHADRDEVKEAEDTGMRALGYGGRPDDEPLPACHATATTRIVAAACYVGATLLMFYLIETTRNYDDKGEVVPWLVITLLCYVVVAVSDPGFADSDEIPPNGEDYVIRRQKVVDFLEEGHDGSTLLPWPDWPPMRSRTRP